ncbi:unnamed protein product [Xylocopa violacea]|uniref:Platelet-derived growth factor (PDGF) family profile domain-containing protein n=1 Tax=Xylocopa violacea TaxID=135666 RepID=A0ABP1N7C9_XYLVO
MSRFVRSEALLLVMVCGLLATAQKNTRYHGDPDDIVFPGPIRSRTLIPAEPPTRRLKGPNELSKSLQLAKKIDSVDSLQEFLSLVKDVPPSEQVFSLTSKMGERSNAKQPTPAKCMPELQPVPLKQDDDPSTIYYPSCTRVNRCGGCCSHSLLSCQPVTSEIRNFEVIVASIDSSSTGLSYSGKQIVPVEEHTSCQCDCKIKEEHCNAKQIYDPDECICKCKNVDEAEKCNANNDTKIWNPELCACFCREELECSTGFYFDQNTCRCKQVPLNRSWFQPTKGADYGFGQSSKPDSVPPVIIPLDASDPRRKPKPDPEYK